MLNIKSAKKEIRFFIFIVLLIHLPIYLFYMKYETAQEMVDVGTLHEELINDFFERNLYGDEALSYFKKHHLDLINLDDIVLTKGEAFRSNRDFKSIKFNDNLYLFVKTNDSKLLFLDQNDYPHYYFGYLLFIVLFILPISVYFNFKKYFQPMDDLKDSISKFAMGDLSVEDKTHKKDEISHMSNIFTDALNQINLLMNSRQLFLRTVMHELKTPIAKGRIVSELIDENKQKDRLVTIFERMNTLIDDFSKVERVISHNYILTKQIHDIPSIIRNADSFLMLDELNNQINFEVEPNTKIEVDFELMSMVVKNLMDNALRYSIDKKVTIKEKDNELLFISKGNPLKMPLNDYFNPFHNDITSKNQGMGLGLYIVKAVLDIHDMEFTHKYKDEHNIFTITFNSIT